MINLPGGIDAWLSLWDRAKEDDFFPESLRKVDWSGNIAAIDWVGLVPLLGIILLLVVFWQGWKNDTPQEATERIANLESAVSRILDEPGAPDQLAPSPADGLPGLRVSRAHIGAGGSLTGSSLNIASVGDVSTGRVVIDWAQSYSNVEYLVSVALLGEGQFLVETQSTDAVTILTTNYSGHPIDIAFNIFAIGEI
ncbi:MAG: hypothetical protein IH963_11630 [Chloroflexi bacterium]|nr:hypothetical protein [Chloroflexota bacterium]